MTIKHAIAERVAKELKNGDVVNLGIGLPTMVADYLPQGVNIILQSENGFLGVGPKPKKGYEDKDLTNAGAKPVTLKKGGCFFDSATSFMLIRGGHVDATVLGALQVDQNGNLANWMVPGKMIPGMGGAMDLVTGAKKVIIAMTHNTKNGDFKILKNCTLPLTAKAEVNLIITELAVIEVTKKGLMLKEVNPNYTVEEVQARTGATLYYEDSLKL